MVEDALIYQEINEELKAERLRRWWQRFGSWVIVACLFIVLGTIAYQYRQSQILEANQAVTALLLGSNDALDRKEYETTAQKLLALPENAGAVAQLARLKAADALQKAGETEAAAAEYRKVSASPDYPALANYAQLRLHAYDEIKANEPYAVLANEMQAISLYQQGRKAEARSLLQQVGDSPETPITARNRARELLAAFQ